MNSNRTFLLPHSIFVIVCAIGLAGCMQTTMVHEQPLSSIEEALLLPEAEQRLKEVIHCKKIIMLGGLSFSAEDPSYLIIEGDFVFDFGGVKSTFILRLDKATDPWEKAEVYWWKSTYVDYEDHNGNRVQRNLLYPSELISLPEGARMSLLEHFETNPPPWLRQSSSKESETNYVY